MKNNDIKSLTSAELTKKLSESKNELFNLRFSHATGQLANPMQLKNVKKTIARIETEIRARQITDSKAGV